MCRYTPDCDECIPDSQIYYHKHYICVDIHLIDLDEVCIRKNTICHYHGNIVYIGQLQASDS